MHNVVLLHAAAVTEKVHFVHLFLVLRLHLLLLSDERSLQLLFSERQTLPIAPPSLSSEP